jgi:hypothetical protein
MYEMLTMIGCMYLALCFVGWFIMEPCRNLWLRWQYARLRKQYLPFRKMERLRRNVERMKGKNAKLKAEHLQRELERHAVPCEPSD